mmetsp:Transcript_10377/g.31726  ORF Transcript_10377/g.31726 Transcript_10377/m.31726 type:complete len:265 (-) Transcript_10377:483-1277(-)
MISFLLVTPLTRCVTLCISSKSSTVSAPRCSAMASRQSLCGLRTFVNAMTTLLPAALHSLCEHSSFDPWAEPLIFHGRGRRMLDTAFHAFSHGIDLRSVSILLFLKWLCNSVLDASSASSLDGGLWWTLGTDALFCCFSSSAGPSTISSSSRISSPSVGAVSSLPAEPFSRWSFSSSTYPMLSMLFCTTSFCASDETFFCTSAEEASVCAFLFRETSEPASDALLETARFTSWVEHALPSEVSAFATRVISASATGDDIREPSP